MDRPLQLEKAVYIFLFACLVVSRLPNAFLQGRFWAEEGSIFFANAWHLPSFQALFAVHTGYLNLTANAATLIASHAPLKIAPLVTAGIALAIQCVPALLILLSRSSWAQHRIAAIAALLVIAIPPAAEEAWLNTINSQHHLALAVGIILALQTERGIVALFQAGVLLLAALSSPASWFLLPPMMLRAAIDKSRPRAIQSLIFLIGIAVEMIWFFSSSQRTFGMPVSLLGAVIYAKHIVSPLTDMQTARDIIEGMAAQFAEGAGPLWPMLTVLAIYAIAMTAALRHPKDSPLWFLIGATFLMTSYLVALGNKSHPVLGDNVDPLLGDKFYLLEGGAGGRYQLAPHVLLMLGILSWSVIEASRTRWIAACLVAWVITAQTLSTAWSSSDASTGPDWRHEVDIWRMNPQHRLLIWPEDWKIELERPLSGRYRPS